MKVPANVKQVPHPPRSPELNPVENQWHYQPSHHRSNPSYGDYDALREVFHSSSVE